MKATLLIGDVLDRLATLLDSCVPLFSDFIQHLAAFIKGLTLRYVLDREGFAWNAAWRSVLVREIAIPRDSGSMFWTFPLDASIFENGRGRCYLDAQKWDNQTENILCSLIRRLKAKQLTPIWGCFLFAVIPSAKHFCQELDRSFIDHAYLDSRMVARSAASLTLVGFGFFDSYVPFPVNYASDVRQIGIRRHISSCGNLRDYDNTRKEVLPV